MKKWIVSLIGLLVIIVLMGCGSVVPPGTTVLILKPKGPPVIVHEGVYKAVGRDRFYFVDTKLKSYSKKLQILCADDINMTVVVKWLGSFKVTKASIDVIKKKVPAIPMEGEKKGFRLSLDAFFKTTMADVLSSITRNVVSPYITDDIRKNREKIRLTIKKKFLERMDSLNYPIETADILVTNLDYPPEIMAKRKKIKDAELQDLENAAVAIANIAAAARDEELAIKRGAAKLVRATTDAAANKIRSASLTPAILAVKQLETLVRLAEGNNNTVVVIPYDAIRPGGLQNTLINKAAIDDLQRALNQRLVVPKNKQ